MMAVVACDSSIDDLDIVTSQTATKVAFEIVVDRFIVTNYAVFLLPVSRHRLKSIGGRPAHDKDAVYAVRL